jgi:hypothetical protein
LKGWTTRLRPLPTGKVKFCLYGVLKVGDWSTHHLLEVFTYSHEQVRQGKTLPIHVYPVEALQYDYVVVVSETTAKQLGWLK